MRKLRKKITGIEVASDTETIELHFNITEKLLSVCKMNLEYEEVESSFTLFDCNPEQIANELLEWCDRNDLDSPEYVSSFVKTTHIEAWPQCLCMRDKEGVQIGVCHHSIPDFKQKLKAELEKILEPEVLTEKTTEKVISHSKVGDLDVTLIETTELRELLRYIKGFEATHVIFNQRIEKLEEESKARDEVETTLLQRVRKLQKQVDNLNELHNIKGGEG